MQPRASTSISERQNWMHYMQVSISRTSIVHGLPKALTIIRVRRVRCDEQKPECNRCVSTGRKCDGYQPISPRNSPSGSHQNTSSTSTEALRKQLRIALPKKNDQEIRSFRYFLDVTAPTIAGVFEAEFWLTYIPRACHLDSTIWH